jgi:hypothetical protein
MDSDWDVPKHWKSVPQKVAAAAPLPPGSEEDEYDPRYKGGRPLSRPGSGRRGKSPEPKMAAFVTGSETPLPLAAAIFAGALVVPRISRWDIGGATLRATGTTHCLTIQALEGSQGTHVALHVTKGPFKDHFSVRPLGYDGRWREALVGLVSRLPEDFPPEVRKSLAQYLNDPDCRDGKIKGPANDLVMRGDRRPACAAGHECDVLCEMENWGRLTQAGRDWDDRVNEMEAAHASAMENLRAALGNANATALEAANAERDAARAEVLRAAARLQVYGAEEARLTGLLKEERSRVAGVEARLTGLLKEERSRLAEVEAENAQLREHVRQSAMAMTLLQRPRGTTARSGDSSSMPGDVSVVRSDATRAAPGGSGRIGSPEIWK